MWKRICWFLAFNDLLIEKGPLFHALFWGGSISMVVDSKIKLKKNYFKSYRPFELSSYFFFPNHNHTQSFSILINLLFGGEMFIPSFSPTHKYYIIIIILIYLYMYIPGNYFANHLKMVGADGVGPQYRY